ncbi:thiamine transporter ThiT [Clostridium tetanomorphum]|uniref:ECF transporter S component n=1 Tax=Clostridium tetanomorphum TaxID=1553 RepID=A0A923E9E0_CLOTT|nr:ECF transporter S component [Clostridium tetanomorphum]KAJ51286.1 hypothetical protein CTM_13518 [Clostridium tetanomorphum DSM 665]MBC2397536.1 ECF transporter S component [Clostridium tetanomorphum]MBP1863633.1 thiamine transporter ThiT [Clostridium tetanomorphum]NRS86209.1 thiamine transporter ThiT [Clostridium tetanomorphum]NRZ95712.1 thiamine transporter ThiT [Clostridium tetanomorphum]
MAVNTKDLVKASLFLALGLIIPYIFHLTGIAGNILLPMHIPVLLCGFISGERCGLIIGFITPIMNSVLTGMPPIYPTAISMAFELAAYGWIAGYTFRKKNYNIYTSLVLSMIIGRFISGFANYMFLTFGGKMFILKIFMINAFVKPIWGILIQLVIIPIIVKILERNNKVVSINGQ